MSTYEFPKGFLWGTATSAHQIEGNNTNSDWWHWEQSKKEGQKYPKEPSGLACDSYNRYEEDFDLCAAYHTNAVRFSIEWARIEPEKGRFDEKEVKHYKNMILAAKKRGLKTFVTLHHFTNPLWFAKSGGWHSFGAISRFVRYARFCARELGDLVDAFITINEPQVFALMAYTNGRWPPNKRNPIYSYIVQMNMIRAHREAYIAMKKVCKVPIGLSKNIVWYETDPFGAMPWDKAAASLLNYLNNAFYLTPLMGKLDFLGLNFYFTKRITNFHFRNPTDYVSDMGWWINPAGLGEILQILKKYNLPIYVTENGVADGHDAIRAHFIRDMVIACGMAVKDGVDLRGYFHWSLIDNFEWHDGYDPKFGLVAIDREDNLKRIPRKSFEYFADICKTNRIEVS